jgi:uncharacterized membrane protein YhiD involved in acid resistance
MAVIAFLLDYFNYGTFYKSEFILIFRSKKTGNENSEYMNRINKFAKTANLIHIQRSGDEESQKLTFDIIMKKDLDPEDMVNELSKIDGITELSLVASKHDIDY